MKINLAELSDEEKVKLRDELCMSIIAKALDTPVTVKVYCDKKLVNTFERSIADILTESTGVALATEESLAIVWHYERFSKFHKSITAQLYDDYGNFYV